MDIHINQYIQLHHNIIKLGNETFNSLHNYLIQSCRFQIRTCKRQIGCGGQECSTVRIGKGLGWWCSGWYSDYTWQGQHVANRDRGQAQQDMAPILEWCRLRSSFGAGWGKQQARRRQYSATAGRGRQISTSSRAKEPDTGRGIGEDSGRAGAIMVQ